MWVELLAECLVVCAVRYVWVYRMICDVSRGVVYVLYPLLLLFVFFSFVVITLDLLGFGLCGLGCGGVVGCVFDCFGFDVFLSFDCCWVDWW